jgi:NADPH:quinone reductase-like Zn-dependent oxidoreductase
MRAIRLHEHGGPEVLRLEEVPVPVPGPGEVLVRVHAAGLNPPDWYLREGMTSVPAHLRPAFALPMVPGTDVSGVVEAPGGGFEPGDEVFGMLRFPGFDGGGYAEYVAAPAADLARKPAGTDHVEAAALPMSGLTAWQFLVELGHRAPTPFQASAHRPVPLGPGSTVLVNGAAGGVGHLAVQVAKWRGARVVAAASGRHEGFVRALGADEFVDYTKERPEEVVHGVDLVLDAVGGPATDRFLPTLRPGGALFPVFPGALGPAERGITVSSTQVRSNGAQLAELAATGAVRAAIDATFPLAEAAAAHERAEAGHLQGKLVLTV